MSLATRDHDARQLYNVQLRATYNKVEQIFKRNRTIFLQLKPFIQKSDHVWVFWPCWGLTHYTSFFHCLSSTRLQSWDSQFQYPETNMYKLFVIRRRAGILQLNLKSLPLSRLRADRNPLDTKLCFVQRLYEVLLFSFHCCAVYSLPVLWERDQQGVDRMIISLIKTQPWEGCSLQQESYYNKKLFFN